MNLAVGAAVFVTGFLGAIGWEWALAAVQGPVTAILPAAVSDWALALLADGLAIGLVALPGIIIGAIIFMWGGPHGPDRCWACGYILNGLTSPDCPECGVIV